MIFSKICKLIELFFLFAKFKAVLVFYLQIRLIYIVLIK